MRTRTRQWSRSAGFRVLGMILVSGALAAGCGDDDDGDGTASKDGKGTPATSTADTARPRAWMLPNGDYENTRVAASSEIDAANVDDLSVAWSQPLDGGGIFGAFASTPLVSEDGVAYVQDLGSNVMAYDLETGEQKWRVDYKSPTIGPNGLAYEDGVLFGVTSTDAFAIQAEDGAELWKRKLITGDIGVAEGQSLGLTIQPAVKDGVVYLAEAATAGGGDIMALDAASGKDLWRFDTTDEPKGDETPSAGSWNTPAVTDDGAVYFTVANGYYSPNSPKSTQNERLYTNSLVKLDAQSGELDWHHQAIPNDFWDWDLHLSPVLANAGGKDLAVVAGKLGYVLALDTDTGEEVWKTSVGKHNGHDQDGQKQLDGTLDLKPPFEVIPGPYGGVETNLAVADGKVYAAVVNLAGKVNKKSDLSKPVADVDFAEGKGEIVRLDLATGEIDWAVPVDTMPLGAITVSNDLVFTTLFTGKLVAYSAEDGSEVWSTDLPAGTNSPLTIVGDTLVTAAGFPQGKDEKPELVVYRLGAERITPPAPGARKGEETPAAGGDEEVGEVLELAAVPGELKFDKTELTAPAGKVTFRFDNPDTIAHNVAVRAGDETIAESDLITKDAVDLTVDLEPGTYEFVCTPHVSAGMKGTLTIK